MKPKCACGCGQRAANKHHIVYQQKLREVVRAESRDNRERGRRLGQLSADPRNLMWLSFGCHQTHHGAGDGLPLAKLPDSVFRFAEELMGAGVAYEYLRRRYSGQDERLIDLLERTEIEAA
jgi:hypothetical protein